MTDNDTKQPGTAGSPNTDFTGVLEQTKTETARPEISAAAVARMMGVATNTEVKLLEGKLDLISSKVNNIAVKMDKIISQFQSLPSGSDLERIDVQIGSLKTTIRDLAVMISGEGVKAAAKPSTPSAAIKETEIVAAAEGETPPAE